MATTGNVFPTAEANVDRAASTAWSFATGTVFADDATNATSTVPTDYLVTSGYGFTIPLTATILGVTVRIEMTETGSGSSSYIPQLHSNTTPTLIGAAKSAISITNGPVVSTSGSATDLWSAALTPAIVNAAGFGVSIWSTDTINGLQCDYVTIAIEYSVPNLWDSRHTFRKRKNSTHRRLKTLRLHESDTVASPVSANRTLEEPFRTRNIRVRRALSIGWIDALTTQIPSVPQPVTAWIEPKTNRRRDIDRWKRPLPPDDQITYPETPPAATVGSAVTFKTRMVASRRQYSAKWTPGVVAPPPVVVEQPVAAWLPTLVLRRKETRRKLIVLSHKAIEQYTPPVIAWFEPPKAIKIEYRRVLQKLTFIKLPPAIGPPAWETKQRAPTFQDRRLLRLPQHDSYPQTPSYAAWLAPRTNRIKRSRKRQTLELNSYAVTPPFPSWGEPKTNRVGQARKLQALPELNFYPPTPPVDSGFTIAAVTLVTQKRRKSRPGIFQTGGQLVEAHPEPSLLNFSPTGYHFRKDIKRTLQPQAPQITYPPTPPIPIAAVILVTNKRRKGRPGIIQTGGLLVEADDQITYPETPPAATPQPAVTFKTRLVASRRQYSAKWTPGVVAPPPVVVDQPVAAWLPVLVLRRKETRRKLIVVSHTAIERYTPPVIAWFAPPKAIKIEYRRVLQKLTFIKLPPAIGPPAWATHQRAAPVANRIERVRKLQPQAPQITYPPTPSTPEQPPTAFLPTGYYFRRVTRRLLQAQAPQLTYPPTPVVVEEPRLGGDDKIRRKSPHPGHDKKRAQLKITEEQRLLADIRRMYRQLQGIEELAPQAEAILVTDSRLSVTPEDDTYTAAKRKLIDQRLGSLASLGTEAEIALRLLYRELEEQREREDEEAILQALALLL